MNESVIQIQHVANGYVVIMPVGHNPFEGLGDALKQAQLNINENKPDGTIKQAENIFIFPTLIEALSFVSLKFENQI